MLKKQDISLLFSKGKKISNDFFIIRFLDNTEKKEENYAITVSRKIKEKPSRNKIKRQVKEMIRTTSTFKQKIFIVIVGAKYNIKTFLKNKESLLSLLKNFNLN